MLTAFLVFLGLLPLSYMVFSIYPAIIVHCLEDSRPPDGLDDFLRMTYLPYLFKCKRLGLPY